MGLGTRRELSLWREGHTPTSGRCGDKGRSTHLSSSPHTDTSTLRTDTTTTPASSTQLRRHCTSTAGPLIGNLRSKPARLHTKHRTLDSCHGIFPSSIPHTFVCFCDLRHVVCGLYYDKAPLLPLVNIELTAPAPAPAPLRLRVVYCMAMPRPLCRVVTWSPLIRKDWKCVHMRCVASICEETARRVTACCTVKYIHSTTMYGVMAKYNTNFYLSRYIS